EGAAIDVAVAGPVLQRNAPLPACAMRGAAGERIGRGDIGGRDGDGPVDREPVAPVLVADAERLADQQGAEARAVDEQVALDALAAFELDRRDVAAFAVAMDADDATLMPPRAMRLGAAAQETGVESGVEVEGVKKVVHDLASVAGRP